jgi:hypothetical protein
MKATAFWAVSLAVCALVVIAWSDRDGAGVVLGQEAARAVKAKADPFATPPSEKKEVKSPREAAIELDNKLNGPANMEFIETPLKDVILYLQELHGIPFVLKVKKLEEAGIAPDKPITKNLKGVRLSTALELILEDLDLTYIVNDGLIMITSIDDAAAWTDIRIYDCRDLLAMGAGGGDKSPSPTPQSAENLVNLIRSVVDAASWSEAGGPGAIYDYNGLVVVGQTAPTHKKIERMLNMLREAAGMDTAKGVKVVR